jgi:beta-glucosidase/6-phospho-beta-glucosidase/beta-galactosidase
MHTDHAHRSCTPIPHSDHAHRCVHSCATLYHWDLPSATYDKGGMLVPEFVGWFDDYATRCFELFDARVSMWITFNEPWCICALGYCSGAHAPGRNRDPGREPYTAAHHLLLAHAKVAHDLT